MAKLWLRLIRWIASRLPVRRIRSEGGSLYLERDKVKLIGNSVCPEVAEVLVRANFGAEAERGAA